LHARAHVAVVFFAMVQFRNAMHACLCFALSSADTADKSVLLNFDKVGNIGFQPTATSEHSLYSGVDNGYGSLKFHHHAGSATQEEAAFFYGWFRPQPFHADNAGFWCATEFNEFRSGWKFDLVFGRFAGSVWECSDWLPSRECLESKHGVVVHWWRAMSEK